MDQIFEFYDPDYHIVNGIGYSTGYGQTGKWIFGDIYGKWVGS